MKSPLESPQQWLPVRLVGRGDLYQFVNVCEVDTVTDNSYCIDCCVLTHSAVDCGSPTTIRNGSPGISTPGTTLGGKVTYTCVSGYEVSTGVTTAMATCMANRMWETLPTCSRMYQIPLLLHILRNTLRCMINLYTAVSCGDPPSGNNASPGIPTNTLYQGAVTYTCVTGYWISQGSFSGFASCMADRTWGPLPTCSRM